MRITLAGRSLKSLAPIPILLTALVFGCVQNGRTQVPQTSTSSPPLVASSNEQVRGELGTFARLAKALKPSVVNIQVEKMAQRQSSSPDDILKHFFDGDLGVNPRPTPQHGQGSGVIISSDGYILTNNHVVSGANSVHVTLADGSEYDAKVVGTDSKVDLALVKVDAKEQLPAARLGDSDKMEVGDWVMAIGNPFGLEETVTVGVLSGTGRVIGAGPYDNYLQTDASINPGNSGGPLFNTSGEVIGINTAIVSGGQGIGFSIPINMAKDELPQLKTGHVVRGFIGLGIQPLSPKLKQALGLPADLKGALVASVVPGGPSDKAGAQLEDVVTAINGRAVVSDRDLLAQVARLPVDSTANLTILRNGHARELSVKVARRPDEEAAAAPQRPTSGQHNELGFKIQDLTPDLAQQLGSKDTDGVVILEVEPGTPAERAGLQAGDIVRRVGTEPVHNSADFVRAVAKYRQQGVALLVERGGNTVFVVVGS